MTDVQPETFVLDRIGTPVGEVLLVVDGEGAVVALDFHDFEDRMMRLLAREGIGLAVLPPIVVREELASGLLIEANELPGIVEAFYAVTVERRFPNPLLKLLLQPDFAQE